MINVRAVDAASEPAVLMLYTIRTAVQTNFLTVRWQNMRRLSVMAVRISILRWFRISARTATAMEGMFASFDPVALDQACADACLKATPIADSQLGEHLAEPGWHCHHDHFKDSNPNIEWKATLDQAEKVGLGTREYELKRIK